MYIEKNFFRYNLRAPTTTVLSMEMIQDFFIVNTFGKLFGKISNYR